ncbi:uncharacterized protein LOC144158953 [Haemaphysalis longicornis]
MPASIYTLCGFASGVDFRPIKFKECLPQVRICCLCGIVPDKMALLPCSHQLCESCLQGCVDADGSVCPIDKELFLVEGEVSWITPSRRHLSKMQVFCWNRENGCDFVGPAEKLLHHFEQECSFHSVSCPGCHDTVLRKDVPHHCKAGCTTLKSPAAPVGKKVASSRAGSEKAPSSYHDILAFIRTGVNELFEAVNEMSLELSGSKEHCEEGIVKEQPPQVSQSLCNLSNTQQEASASVHRGTSSAERATLGITMSEHDFAGPPEGCVVLAYNLYLCKSNDRNNGEEDTFTLCFDGEVTNVKIQCLVSWKDQFVCLSAKLTEPGKWCLPDIEPLLSTQPLPSSLRGIVYRKTKYVADVDKCLHQGFLVLSIRETPSSPLLADKKTGRKVLSFLVRMKRSDIRNSQWPTQTLVGHKQ